MKSFSLLVMTRTKAGISVNCFGTTMKKVIILFIFSSWGCKSSNSNEESNENLDIETREELAFKTRIELKGVEALGHLKVVKHFDALVGGIDTTSYLPLIENLIETESNYPVGYKKPFEEKIWVYYGETAENRLEVSGWRYLHSQNPPTESFEKEKSFQLDIQDPQFKLLCDKKSDLCECTHDIVSDEFGFVAYAIRLSEHVCTFCNANFNINGQLTKCDQDIEIYFQ